jgi:hypothetical protein
VTLLNKANQTKQISFNHTISQITLEMRRILEMSGGNFKAGEVILVEVIPFNWFTSNTYISYNRPNFTIMSNPLAPIVGI